MDTVLDIVDSVFYWINSLSSMALLLLFLRTSVASFMEITFFTYTLGIKIPWGSFLSFFFSSYSPW